MLWIALFAQAAAQVAAPRPIHPSRWFEVRDVPQYLLTYDGGLWWVPVRMTVSPNGKLESCQVEATSRVRALDELTCAILLQRAKFQPARMEGVATFGVYRTSVRWAVDYFPRNPSDMSNPDIDVGVERLPPKLKSPTLVRVMFAVDAKGNKSSCTAEPYEGLEHADNDPALVPTACEQVLAGLRVAAPIESGQPVPSVQDALVRVTAQPVK